MRLSQVFGRTLRDAPADAVLANHQLIVRAGLARPLAAGVWSYLPIGWRVIRHIEAILREEMDAIGVDELHLPLLHPAEVWQATGRWSTFGDTLQRLTNREGRAFALGPTHEEVVVDLCRREVESYKDLPRMVYQIQTKVRDEPRARGGLIRLREFLMKDAYSLHVDDTDLDAFYPSMVQAYHNVFRRCGLAPITVEADSGLMGGRISHEFVLPHPQGEDRFVRCDGCDYAANVEAAVFSRGAPATEAPKPLEKVATPDSKTIADLCAFLNIAPQQTLKAVFYAFTALDGSTGTALAMLRGDLDVNEARLMKALGALAVGPATEEQIAAMGAVAGYASPIGLDVRAEGASGGVLVLADKSLRGMANFVTGANEAGRHVLNANTPRDFAVTRFGDIAEAYEGAPCAHCDGTLHVESAVEMGHCFKLGTFYSSAVGATYADEGGALHPVVMGSYGIGLDRLMAAIIEQHHDEYGIIWPREVAPFDVHLVALGDDEAITRTADSLYADLQQAGLSALYDDRHLSPGVMFADADLIGAPLRVTVSQRSLSADGVEVKWRHQKDRSVMPLEGTCDQIAEMFAGLP